MWRLKVATTEAGDGAGSIHTLNEGIGRQVWVFDPDGGTPQQRAAVDAARQAFTANRHKQKHSSDLLLRIQYCEAPNSAKAETHSGKNGILSVGEQVEAHIRKAVEFYGQLQADDGHFPGDYGGPMFLMPGMVIALYVMGELENVLTPAHQEEMRRYLVNHQNEDGGYGLHIEGHSTMFGTSLSYVTLRLLGMPPENATLVAARQWMHNRGTALNVPSWGKFWLAVLGCYDWKGLNPLPPEIWLVPYALPIHPGRLWCHCRMVYLPMSYVYGRRGSGTTTDLVSEIRNELYGKGEYAGINWNKARFMCATEDLFYPHPWIQDRLWDLLYALEPYIAKTPLRTMALNHIMKHIHYEDENTRYVDIGPVNKVINMLACWLENPRGEAYKRHIPRLMDYLWLAEDGMKMQGYNGSQLWDTAFAAQALVAAGAHKIEAGRVVLEKAFHYIDDTQVREDAPESKTYYRHISKGAWPFSTRDHGWPISDCSSEGLKAVLALNDAMSLHLPDEDERLFDCVNVILSYQNSNDGWATYESTRGPEWLELLNPAECFGDIMIDYSHVECSSACVQSLASFQQKYPNHRSREIFGSIMRGRSYLEKVQNPDGSWYGNWGVCYTYATWFGVLGLKASGLTYDTSSHIRKACEFLLDKQLPRGGWGESYLSCQDMVYTSMDRPHAVNTAWAMLALLAANQLRRDRKPLDRAAKVLMDLQLSDGDWPQQSISGVFNRNCMITYANYRNIFPIWALGEYRKALMSLPD